MGGENGRITLGPRHHLDIEILGPVEVIVARGAAEAHDLVAIAYGRIGDRPLVRVHSHCLYGDVFGSHDCDCRAQLEASMQLIREAGSGVIIYLDQEGRGAGLFRKAQGYEISQSMGMDSYEAYEALGIDTDSRQYGDAAEMLKAMGIRAIDLLTNNPEKVRAMEVASLDVRRVRLDLEGLGLTMSEQARLYVESKRNRGYLK